MHCSFCRPVLSLFVSFVCHIPSIILYDVTYFTDCVWEFSVQIFNSPLKWKPYNELGLVSIRILEDKMKFAEWLEVKSGN